MAEAPPPAGLALRTGDAAAVAAIRRTGASDLLRRTGKTCVLRRSALIFFSTCVPFSLYFHGADGPYRRCAILKLVTAPVLFSLRFGNLWSSKNILRRDEFVNLTYLGEPQPSVPVPLVPSTGTIYLVLWQLMFSLIRKRTTYHQQYHIVTGLRSWIIFKFRLRTQ